MKPLRKKNAQTTIEYAVAIAAIVGALIAMQFYVKRAIQGRLRTAADDIGEQYEPGKTEGDIVTTVNRDIRSTIVSDVPIKVGGEEGYGTLRSEYIHRDETVREGAETVSP